MKKVWLVLRYDNHDKGEDFQVWESFYVDEMLEAYESREVAEEVAEKRNLQDVKGLFVEIRKTENRTQWFYDDGEPLFDEKDPYFPNGYEVESFEVKDSDT